MENTEAVNELLRLENVSVLVNKRFLVQDISFTLKKGEVLGIVGKNASGKTSLLKAIARALPITEGEVYFDGQLVYKDKHEIHKSFVSSISTALDPPMFYKWQTILENIKFIAQLKPEYNPNEITALLKSFGLYHKRNMRVMSLSYYEKKKMSLILCLISKPKLIMLDEPFRSLNEEALRELLTRLRALAQTGTGIIISSANVEKLNRVCSSIIFMEDRQIKKVMTNKELNNFTSTEDYTFIKTKYPNYAGKIIMENFDIKVKLMGNKVLLLNAPEDQITSIIKFLTEKKFIIYSAGKIVNRTEEIFASLTPFFKEEA